GAAAVVPGEVDLSLGLSLVRDEASSARLTLLAANLRDASGQPPFPASKIVKVAGRKVLLIGLVDPALIKAPLSAADPAASAPEAIAAWGAVDLVIGIGHLSRETQTQLLATVPRLDAVIAAHGGEPMPASLAADGGIRVRPGEKGRALFRLDLRL